MFDAGHPAKSVTFMEHSGGTEISFDKNSL